MSAIHGMNVFAAIAILCRVTLDQFLSASSQERLECFGTFVWYGAYGELLSYIILLAKNK